MYTDGPLLVLAGAGSGKTKVLTHRVAYFISQGLIKPENALLLTFTNKAAKEMRERAMSMLQGKGYKTPLISTFHSLCLNILRREIDKLGYRQDFTIFDTSDQHSLLRNILSEIKFEDKSFKPENIMERISMTKNDMITPRMKKAAPDDLEIISDAVYPKYREAMRTLLVRNADGTDNYTAEANQNFAGNLKGHLLLAHGTMDTNVPPYQTLMVVDALIKANKDFDLLMLPNQNHGYGPASSYMMRRRWDYFVKWLLGVDPPKEYKMQPAGR